MEIIIFFPLKIKITVSLNCQTVALFKEYNAKHGKPFYGGYVY